MRIEGYHTTVDEISQSGANDRKEGHTKDCVNAAVIFWIVGNLCVLSKYDLAARCDKPKLGDVNLNDGAFRHDT